MKKPEPTDDEIRSHMNFDKLLQSYQQSNVGPGRTPKWMKLSGVVVASIALIVTSYLFLTKESDTNHHTSIEPKGIVDTISTLNESKTVSEQQEQKQEQKQKPANSSGPSPSQKTEKKVNTKKDSAAADSKSLSKFTEASPVDGYPALYSYFDRELKYPGVIKDSIQGVVTMSFAINETGKPDRIKIENSLGPVFDAECIRLIENMPPWKPATINDKPVRTRLSIPLTFKIKK